jgi:hypothetical protein
MRDSYRLEEGSSNIVDFAEEDRKGAQKKINAKSYSIYSAKRPESLSKQGTID